MKQLSMLTRLLALFVLIGFISSCDPIELADPPIVSFDSGVDVLSGDAVVGSGEEFTVRLSAIKGTENMKSLTIREDGVTLDTDRFTIDGLADNNPKLLLGGDEASFTYDITIRAHASGDATYTFVVDDAGATVESSSASLVISIDVATTAPKVSYVGSSFIALDNPTTLSIEYTVEKGGSPLATMEVLQDGVTMTDLTRIGYKELSNKITSNPYDIPAEDKDGFVNDIYLKTQSTFTSSLYTFIFTDEAGGVTESQLTVSLLMSEEPITTEYVGVLMYNNAGSNFGALDLNTGTNVSSVSSTAGDLVDLGNDSNGDWRRQMGPLGGSVLKSLAAGEVLTYADVTTKEKVKALYDGGTSLAETGTLTVGSTYTAFADGEYFILRVSSVSPTTGDNNDNYTFDIKKG